MPIGSPNAGYLTFNTGQVLTAAQVQYNLQNQTIMYFANATARDAALPGGTVQEGMFAYLADSNSTVFYNGTVWETLGDMTNGTLTSPKETIEIVAAGSASTVNVDILTASVEYYTGAATADWTLNVRGSSTVTLNSLMAVGEQLSVVYLNTNTGTAYKPNVAGFEIDSVAVTPKWLGGTAPASGNINSIDAYVYTIIKTATTPTPAYTVLASQSKFA